jgi:hypothetical protein
MSVTIVKPGTQVQITKPSSPSFGKVATVREVKNGKVVVEKTDGTFGTYADFRTV